MKIAFVSVEDPNDPHSWSGIPFHMLGAIRRKCPVEVIAPLHRSFRYMYVGHKILGNISHRRFQIDRQPLALRSYRKQIANRLKTCGADVVFAPSSVPVSLLDTRLPILFWTDAVWEPMLEYYDGFSRLSRTSLINGHKQDKWHSIEHHSLSTRRTGQPRAYCAIIRWIPPKLGSSHLDQT